LCGKATKSEPNAAIFIPQGDKSLSQISHGPAKGSLAALRAATAAYEERRAADEAAALARAAASELNAAARALSDFEQELTQAREDFTLRVAVCDTLQLDLCRGVPHACLGSPL